MRAVAVIGVLGLSLLLWVAVVAADDGDERQATLAARKADAKQVVAVWFDAVMSGQSAVAASLSDVPFSFDRKMTLKTHEELRKMYEQIAEEKGKRQIEPDEIFVASVTVETVEVVLKIEGEGIMVTVKSGAAPRVTGFWD